MNKQMPDIDALLREAARRETEQAGLSEILQKVLAEHPLGEGKRPRGHKRLYLAAALATAALVVFAAAFMLTKPVAVNGKTFLAFQDKVVINGVTRRLGIPDENGLLLQVGSSNGYVDMESVDEAAKPQVFVYAPGGSPKELKNPDAVSGKGEEPELLTPVTVYPVVGDLTVREGPDTAYRALGELYSGQCVTKVGVHGNWAIIAWNGALAYAFNAYLFEVPKAPPGRAPVTLVATEPVNVRALPGSKEDSAVLHELQTGEAVQCTGSIGQWNEIEWNGQRAYVFAKYLKEGTK